MIARKTPAFCSKRQDLKQQIKSTTYLEEKLALYEITKLPRDSSAVRLHNRCLVTGRPKVIMVLVYYHVTYVK
jgi:small subunit ribosomal protein S14